ncbi:RecF/RecN/SMC family protein [Phytobacter diazotrophicus]|nr:RecF/RecN/SMC family protein [Phytobacter diazotrophicus]
MPELAQEAIGTNDFEKWLNGRNRWLQTAAKQLIDNKRLPSVVELTELVRLCKLEAAKQNDSGFLKVAPGAFSAALLHRVVRVEELSQVFGVNAIKPGASLPFGAGNLAVIYGQNGSGKSSFSRLLKQLCGSRSRDEIRPNVFSSEEHTCSAQCRITIDGNPVVINWQSGAEPHPMLKYAQVFDSKAATQYMGRTESSFEPSSMRFISLLIQISGMVSDQLGREKEKLVRALPLFPGDLTETAENAWFCSLKASISAEKIESFCQYGNDLENERLKSEALLAEKDIKGRLVAIGKEEIASGSIKQAMRILREGLADGKAGELFKAKELAVAARNAANMVAQQAFATAPLQGVGETAWKLMWEQARNYSIAHAYHNREFPVTTGGAYCVLCQQELTEEGSARLKSFEAFVTAGLETTAKTAEATSAALIAKVVQLPSIEDWVARLAYLNFDETFARACYETLKARRSQFEACAAVGSMPTFNWALIDQAIEKRVADLIAEKVSLTQLQQDGQRLQLEKRVKQLRALQWLFQNKIAILAERERLVAVDLLDKAMRLAASNSLTTKRTELARTELDAGYQSRFDAELKALGGRRLPVMPQCKAQGKGVITFGLTLIGARTGFTPEVVLSEGEARIVALAAFLADTTGSNQLAPFIFDDPISSLDQDFEERVVARLVELAKTRQVIIFTHRLSLVSIIEAVIKKHGENPANEKINHTVQSLRRLDKISGILAQHSLRDAKPDKALNVIRDQVIPKLKKHQAEADADVYDLTAKSACSDFRIILERIVEFVLLNDVVVRFRRDVMTKGKLRGITKVKTEDCDVIDALMTKYSVYEHSQADELPLVPVELDEFEKDVLELITWMNEFKTRIG